MERVVQLTVQQKAAIDKGIVSLDAVKGITHQDAMAKARTRFPHLFR